MTVQEMLDFEARWEGPHDERYFAERVRVGGELPPDETGDQPPPDDDILFGPGVPDVPDVPDLGAERQATLSEYLTLIADFLTRYVAFPSGHEPVAIALWVAHAHIVGQFETSPILAVTSAEMRSGKTLTLDCLELLAPNPFRAVTPSEAVVYTVLSQRPRPTLLLDEADAIFGKGTSERYEGLRAILNAGNRQGTPVLRVRMEGSNREIESFDVFGPKAIAGIGKLPDTVTDRSVPIRMKRRAHTEKVAKFRRRTARAEADAIAMDWRAVSVLSEAKVPDELHDRAADSWEPLLAIADAAGGEWPAKAWAAAIALSAQEELQVTTGMRLLADIREVFGDRDHLHTSDLLNALHDIEDAPWAEWFGRLLTATQLAKLLAPFRIRSARRRIDGTNLRGYSGTTSATRGLGMPLPWPRNPERPERPERPRSLVCRPFRVCRVFRPREGEETPRPLTSRRPLPPGRAVGRITGRPLGRTSRPPTRRRNDR